MKTVDGCPLWLRFHRGESSDFGFGNRRIHDVVYAEAELVVADVIVAQSVLRLPAV